MPTHGFATALAVVVENQCRIVWSEHFSMPARWQMRRNAFSAVLYVARNLPQLLHFATMWVVGLQRVEAGEYLYAMSHLDLSEGNAPVLLVRIGRDFDTWQVSRIQ
jgi:hypothetical protein